MSKNNKNLSLEEIDKYSDEYLRGFSLLKKHGITLPFLNNQRKKNGLDSINELMREDYILEYVESIYTREQIESEIYDYLSNNLVANTRHYGIEILGCRFKKNYAKMFRKFIGSDRYNEISEETRVKKLIDTQYELYGGTGLAGDKTYKKALNTVRRKYGVDNVMKSKEVTKDLVTPFADKKIRKKALKSKAKRSQEMIEKYKETGILPHNLFKKSPLEKIVYIDLVDRFGKDDVYYQYGIHPKDERYPFSCDFYVKSLDLFIELNAHWTHGKHWFDENNHDDNLRLKHILESGKRSKSSYDTFIKTWTNLDVKKRKYAKKNKLNYLVFWGNDLVNYYIWLEEYECDFEEFLKEYPENTY